MAQMYPNLEPAQIEHNSELLVYQALKEQLPDQYVVLYSYTWLSGAAGMLREGEADFVILHRDKGMLVLEVKGGELLFERNTWYRQLAGGARKEIQNPLDQARKSMHVLYKLAQERGSKLLRSEPLRYENAVMFPHCVYRGPLPASTRPELFMDSRSLNDLHAAIDAAFGLRGDERGMSAQGFDDLREALMPALRLYRPKGLLIDDVSRQLKTLTELQQQVFAGIYENERVLIDGHAGSGKTLLALDRALAFARSGKRTLLTCYNKTLAAWLQRCVNADPESARDAALLDIKNFHALAMGLAGRARVELSIPSDPKAAHEFWRDEMPLIMEQALLVLGDEFEPYEAIVVDEGQDFFELWWCTLTDDLIVDDAPIYVFRDMKQSLWGGDESLPIDLPMKYSLAVNCRNTQLIAKTSAAVASVETPRLGQTPRGVIPQLIKVRSAAEQRGRVINAVRELIALEKLRPDQIALIGPRAWGSGSLAGLAQIDDHQLTDDALAWAERGELLVTTARSFKGLEADAIILYDLDGFSELFTRTDMYVACTRAKYLLIAICHGTESNQALVNAVQAATR